MCSPWAMEQASFAEYRLRSTLAWWTGRCRRCVFELPPEMSINLGVFVLNWLLWSIIML